MQNRQVLRQLCDKETSYWELQKVFVLNFHIKSKTDLFANLGSVKTAINKWKIKHLLLRAQIAKDPHEQKFFLVL
jgi:hypothetical protein